MPMAETAEVGGDLSKGISLSTAMLTKLQTLPVLFSSCDVLSPIGVDYQNVPWVS
jgi:hypothetical protein